MGAAKKLEMLPEEKFIQDALRDGRAFRTEISLKAIGKPDVRFQARVDPLDLDHVSRLGRILEEQGALHPIVVFYNPKTKKYLVADGFHRHDTYRRAKKDAIPAYQIEGDERDALEYCTMCNRLAMKGRTKEDVKKAVEMLLGDETWWGRSDPWIAAHIGCSHTLVRQTRAKSIADGKDEPETVQNIGGSPRPFRVRRGNQKRICLSRPGRWAVKFEGVCISGKSREDVQRRLDEAASGKSRRRLSLSRDAFHSFVKNLGFQPAFSDSGLPFRGGLSGYYREGFACTRCDFGSAESLAAAIGRLVAIRQHKESGARAVVVCYEDDGFPGPITLYKQGGFEFVTPEELAESLDAEKTDAI
jgi:hypothetical protein